MPIVTPNKGKLTKERLGKNAVISWVWSSTTVGSHIPGSSLALPVWRTRAVEWRDLWRKGRPHVSAVGTLAAFAALVAFL